MARKLPTNIEAGELRHRISIVKPTGGQDSMGGITLDPSQWQVVVSCWAEIQTWTGDMSLSAQEFMSVASHWITIRHPHIPITSQMKVWFSGRIFQVLAVLNPTEQNKILVLVCTEINDSMQTTPVPVAP